MWERKKKVYRNRNASLLCQSNEFPLYHTTTEEGEVMYWHCVGEYGEWIGVAICVTDFIINHMTALKHTLWLQMCHRTNTHSGNLKARNTSWLALLIRKSWVFFFQPVLTATLDTLSGFANTIMTGLIKLSAGTTGCEWRIRTLTSLRNAICLDTACRMLASVAPGPAER